jgi:hypothetical protein
MGSRFQLVPAAVTASPPLGRWPTEWRNALPVGLGWSFAHHSNDTPSFSTAWRLVGANNRELGRSARTYENVAACRNAVAYLCENVEEAESRLGINNDTGLWTWRLDIGDQWLAAAGRFYQRRRECQYNVARFLAAAPTADLVGDLLGRSRPRDVNPWPSGLASPIDLTTAIPRVRTV